MMLERILHATLTDGIAWYAADTRRYERFLIERCGIEADEAAKARAYFGSSDGVPKVNIGYARGVGPFPCFAIILAADNFKQTYLGNDQGPGWQALSQEERDELDDQGLGAEFKDEDRADAEGRAWTINARYEVWIYALDNPDICLYYYYLARQIILKWIDEALQGPIESLDLGGGDMAPDPRYMPENMFIRRLAITCQYTESAYIARGPRGTVIEGAVHSDQDGGGIEPYEEST